MRKISFDFDNVLWNFEKNNIKLIKEIYGEDITSAEVLYWDYYKDKFPLIVPSWCDWNLYKQGEFFQGDQDFIKELQKNYEVQIITASAPELEVHKDKMIYERYGDLRIVHTREKEKFSKNSILVDDALHNCIAHIQEHSQPAIIVDRGYGWNQGFSHKLVLRANNFETIKECIYHFSR